MAQSTVTLSVTAKRNHVRYALIYAASFALVFMASAFGKRLSNRATDYAVGLMARYGYTYGFEIQ